MTVGVPNFSPFPFAQLPRLTRDEAVVQSAIARHLAARPVGDRLRQLLGAGSTVRFGSRELVTFDPDPVLIEVRTGALSIVVAASCAGIRPITQRLFGGPAELAAPRPPTAADHAALALVVATALTDAGLTAEVWPLSDAARALHGRELVAAAVPEATVAGSGRARERSRIAIELLVELRGAAGSQISVIAWCPTALVMRAPPDRPLPAWTLACPIVVARCALAREAVGRLAVRDVVVVERELALRIGDGGVRLEVDAGAVEATVATGYVRAEMAVLDDAHVELTVQLGTTRLSLRRIGELAVGEVVSLGRPLAGPYEIHAGGRMIGSGELVDLDGELGVRILSLTQE